MSEWKTVRLGDFLHRQKQPIQLDADKDYALVTIRTKHKGVRLREMKKGGQIGSKMYQIKKGQFILSGIDARHGAFGIVPDELDGAIVTNDFWYFDVDESVVKRDFFYWLTTTPIFLDACIKSSKGETQRVRLQKDAFYNFEFNFPPVAKQTFRLKHLQTIDNSMMALSNEQSHQKTYLTKLRQAILQEAIEGQLTADWRVKNPVCLGDPNTDTAALLATIKAEKQALIADGKIKKEKPLSPINPDDVPFALPDGWVWVRLGEVIISAKDGPHFSPQYSEKGIPFISTRNISVNGIDFTTAKYISEELHLEISKRCKPKKGDVLYTKGGTTGVAVVNSTDVEFNVWVHVAVLKKPQVMYEYYIQHVLNSLHCYKQSQILTHGIGNQDLGLTRMVLITLPLPPLAEQQAIVERVDRLLNHINALEQQVTERKHHAEQLMQAVLKEAFSG